MTRLTLTCFAFLIHAAMASGGSSFGFERPSWHKRMRLSTVSAETEASNQLLERELDAFSGMLELESNTLSIMSMSLSLSLSLSYSETPTSPPTATPSDAPSTSPSLAPSGTPSQTPSLLPTAVPSALPSAGNTTVPPIPTTGDDIATFPPTNDDLVVAPGTGEEQQPGSSSSISPLALGATIAMSAGGILALMVWAHKRRTKNQEKQQVGIVEDISLASSIRGDESAAGSSSVYIDA